ncbi:MULTISPECIES: BglG family transcription antiterminator [unclassified Halanaerobium]|uniref:BglG family transcription antiterminator n=1 Tax=unclassified Halanaerobium TaxID=2641197 RepID=UPI000DF24D20|nr:MULTISPECIES: BglG family transcription antiterminator [unclassified Halanaerobium]RCW47365.1 transcriptional antiterminator [Halanaerobium sp. MA284_MarDTE_T2]RCW84904.1 transcriptional antiterminator [Halanaerobium sp. DL-01]
MQLTYERLNKIIYLLLQSDSPITIQALADKLTISRRTVRKDLKELQKFLDKKGFKLIKKPNVGVWLELDDNEMELLQNELLDNLKNSKQLTPKQRQNYILKLIFENSDYNVSDLSRELYVSDATIYKDLKDIRDWLKKYNLQLIKNENGLNIEGKEKNWRKFTAELLVKVQNESILNNFLNINDDNSRIDQSVYRSLKDLFTDVNMDRLIEVLENILIEVENELDFSFTDQTFNGLIIHTAISIERLKANKNIVMDKDSLNSLKNKEEYRIAKFIAKKINKELDISLPDSEIGYMCLHILGSKSLKNVDTDNLDDLLKTVDPEIIETASSIIEMSEDILNVSLQNDRKLFTGLILHLRPAVNRLRYGLSLRNPLLENIKKNYPNVFGAAWATSIIFKEKLDLQIKEEEVAYIALHLGAALERRKRTVNLLLVCGSGIGTAQLLASKLQENFVNINISDSISLHSLKNYNLTSIDLIISTVPVKIEEKPFIQVNPLLLEEDIKKIKGELTQFKNSLSFNTYAEIDNSLFDKDLIFPDLNINSKEELLNFLINKLVQKGIVKKNFSQSVFAREELTSTEITKGMAIPHGDNEFVLRSRVAVAILQKGIKWSDDSKNVNIIFLLALKDKAKAKKFFRVFNLLVKDEQFFDNLIRADSVDQIYSQLSKNTL